MRRVLFIVTDDPDPLVREILERQRALPGCAVEEVRLAGPAPDYRELLGKIFAADSVQVW